MLKNSKAFSSFSVDDIAKAKDFYVNILGLEVSEEAMGTINLRLGSGVEVMMYPKGEAHESASFTIINFPVDDIDQAVDMLSTKGVNFEQYDNEWMKTDKKGIARSEDLSQSPHMAWFTDPAGNILAIMQL